jgi:hypothetical protein
MTYLIDSENPRAGLRGYSGAGGLGTTMEEYWALAEKAVKDGRITHVQAGTWFASVQTWETLAAPFRALGWKYAAIAQAIGPRPALPAAAPKAAAAAAAASPLLPAGFPVRRVPGGAGVIQVQVTPTPGVPPVEPPPEEKGKGSGLLWAGLAAAVVVGALVLRK